VQPNDGQETTAAKEPEATQAKYYPDAKKGVTQKKELLSARLYLN